MLLYPDLKSGCVRDRIVSKLAVVEQLANIIGIGTSLFAAFFWMWASCTKIPAFPDVGLDSYSSVFDPVRNALRLASRRNAIAAFFASLAAIAYAVVFACHELRTVHAGPFS